ncbi:hypothetical protein F5887DRAFT_889178 [Amanita rubescens]|nr:hypothetical protein F5887DRAFT_889178 [Amanita rubescens]
MLQTDKGIAAALVRQGMVPCSPFAPKYTISIRTLKLFKNLRSRCPHLTVQPFVNGILDMLGSSCQVSYYSLFSTAFDVYLEILNSTQHKVSKALQRDDPQWRLKNTCPACSYKLKGEKKLTFEMLITMDGNNSLKRLQRNISGENMTTKAPRGERIDSRPPPGDYYISREEVDKWARVHVEQEVNANTVISESEQSACESRWNNMKQEVTSRAWGVFDETGIFLSLCRHGFALLVTDMVQSGELSKYPLATVNALLTAFGPNLGIGYDIGCQFKKTVAKSQLRELASNLNYKSLVGSFHGHAHNRRCQLSHLATYVEGLGLEDLEGCERFFSKSNALARSIRYASTFHRQQSIVLFLKHMDNFETYANLSRFLVNNYKQATEILRTEPTLRSAMQAQGISDTSVFTDWLEEERQYLEQLKQEPAQDTLEMEYYQRLVALYDYDSLETQQSLFINSTPQTVSQQDRTRSIETKRRQLLEKRDNVLDVVHGLEVKLGIVPEKRWVPSSEEWAAAAEKVRLRNYRKKLDHLEALIVARIFELSKMNMPQIGDLGYNLRDHIADALKARSQAVRTALNNYNTAASSLIPSAPQLSWKEVVQYAFLSDFDLLRCARQDIREKPWANPTNWVLRDQFFKLVRAREEIARLNIEIRRVITYMQDEELFLEEQESALRDTQPELAYQISLYKRERSRSNIQHKRRFGKLGISPSFTGDMSPGTAISQPRTGPVVPREVPMAMSSDNAEDPGNDSDEDEFDHTVEDITYSLFTVSLDDNFPSQDIDS